MILVGLNNIIVLKGNLNGQALSIPNLLFIANKDFLNSINVVKLRLRK